MKKTAGLFISALLLICISPIFSQKSATYSVSLFVNDVQISHNGKTWTQPEIDMLLQESDSVKTGDSSYCDITMPSRGNFRIIDNSLVTINTLKKQIEAIKVKKGKAFFNISKKLETGESFSVETKVAVASVRGTEFVIDADDSKVDVSVAKGRVVITRNVKIPEGANTADLQKYLQVEATENQTIELTQDENTALENLLNRVKNNRAEMLKILSDSHDQTQKKIQMLKGNIKRTLDELNQSSEATGTNAGSTSSEEDDTSGIINKTKGNMNK